MDSIIGFIDRNQKFFYSSFDLKVAGRNISPSYFQAGMIIFLFFMVFLTLARFRRLYVKWSMSGWHAWVFIGFLLALLMEGFLLIGGKTLLSEVFGWQTAPKPIATVLDSGRNSLINVLGVNDEIPESIAGEKVTRDEILKLIDYLDPQEQEAVKSQICTP